MGDAAGGLILGLVGAGIGVVAVDYFYSEPGDSWLAKLVASKSVVMLNKPDPKALAARAAATRPVIPPPVRTQASPMMHASSPVPLTPGAPQTQVGPAAHAASGYFDNVFLQDYYIDDWSYEYGPEDWSNYWWGDSDFWTGADAGSGGDWHSEAQGLGAFAQSVLEKVISSETDHKVLGSLAKALTAAGLPLTAAAVSAKSGNSQVAASGWG